MASLAILECSNIVCVCGYAGTASCGCRDMVICTRYSCLPRCWHGRPVCGWQEGAEQFPIRWPHWLYPGNGGNAQDSDCRDWDRAECSSTHTDTDISGEYVLYCSGIRH